MKLVTARLAKLPPLVTPREIEKLKTALKDAAEGKAFLLQGGDCAELFDYCNEEAIIAKVKLLLQMSLVLISGLNKPVIRIARMGGQYAKPRSSPTETLPDGSVVQSFRGDILNGYELSERKLDPSRLFSAYFHSAATLNYVRAEIAGGIADLRNPLDWSLGHVEDEKLRRKYEGIVTKITDALDFMQTIGADSTTSSLKTVDLYTSHEGLVLEYEEALVRHLAKPLPSGLRRSRGHSMLKIPTDVDKSEDSISNGLEALKLAKASLDSGYYATSAHFLWIGDRTRQLDGGHVEFFRGIENPIGIKVGPSMENDELVKLLDIVNPSKEVGKVTLITRYGAKKIEEKLAGHIQAVKESGHVVVWQCDPMHG